MCQQIPSFLWIWLHSRKNSLLAPFLVERGLVTTRLYSMNKKVSIMPTLFENSYLANVVVSFSCVNW